MRINTIKNCGLLVLKTGGMVLFFLLFKSLLEFIFGSKMDFFINNFWLFAFAGIIPAYIAWIKGHSFWIWWIAGTLFPIVLTFLAIDIDDLNKSSE